MLNIEGGSREANHFFADHLDEVRIEKCSYARERFNVEILERTFFFILRF